jgi:hypothetical protein
MKPSRQRRLLLMAAAVAAMVVAVVAMGPRGDAPEHTFRIALGLKDGKPSDWSGQAAVADGQLVRIEGWRFEGKEAVGKDGTSWKCATHNHIAPRQRYPLTTASGRPRAAADLRPAPNGITLTVRGNDPTVTLTLARGAVKFKAGDVLLGEPKTVLDGQVRIERLPATNVLRPAAPLRQQNPVQDDYPAFWVRYKTRKHYLAWVAYQKSKDRVLLVEREGPAGKWSEPLEVAGPGDHFRVAIASTHGEIFWIVWSSQRKGNWDLYARPYQGGKLGKEIRLTDNPGPDIWHCMTTDGRGRAWLVWQGFRDGQSDIFARCADGDGWHEVVKVSSSKANDWNPCVAADSKEDRVWVGWDTYEGGNYGIRVRSLSGGPKPKLGEVLTPEKTPLFGAHVSLASDRAGRLWAAWDESGPQWGKDTGFLYQKSPATRLYASRALRIKVLVDGQWREPEARLEDVLPAELKEYNELPQLQGDTEGRMWLAFRHRTCWHPREDGWAIQGRWDVFATAFLGGRWTAPVLLPHSGGRNDMRASSQRDPDGNVYFAHASDNRSELPRPPVGMGPRNLSVAVSRLSGAAKPGQARFVRRERKAPAVELIHPNEAEQVRRIRAYKVEAGGKTYRIYRGDLHRHTDISVDGIGDGSLMDLHRYALDAIAFDYVLVTDHNMGGDKEYPWWRTQKANDLYTVPGRFISMYGYERSVRYPNGHRNVIWTERGHRTLPLPQMAIPAQMKRDTARLYAELRRTGGICTLHTSATDQGTDWADKHDPALEPFVELFQGYHTSYEAPGAPKTVNDETDMIHGPYKPLGFVNLALDRGYRLGFQASSDHISTHVSYACIVAEEFSRKGLVEAMRKRHTYAATDNIVLDVRIGSLGIMGDEVRTGRPALDVIVLGTGPIDRVEVIRNGTVAHTARPGQEATESRFHWEDPSPRRGEKPSYYYVRVVQKDGQMAWASPIWVHVGK